MLTYLTGQLLSSTESFINEKVKYTANTKTGKLDTANSNLDGTGSIVELTTGASNGTLVKTLTVKAIQNVSRGMIRLFLYDGTNTRLIDEIAIPERTKSGTQDSFYASFELNFSLKASYKLYASTENSETFHVTVESLDYSYPTSLNGL